MNEDVERDTRIELVLSAWEAEVLPLNESRVIETKAISAVGLLNHCSFEHLFGFEPNSSNVFQRLIFTVVTNDQRFQIWSGVRESNSFLKLGRLRQQPIYQPRMNSNRTPALKGRDDERLCLTVLSKGTVLGGIPHQTKLDL